MDALREVLGHIKATDPCDLLKFYVYSYLNHIRSSRKLEAETHRNLEVIWLLRQLRPDYKKIADFHQIKRSAYRLVFREFVALYCGLDLYSGEMIAMDGTKLKVVKSRHRSYTGAKMEKTMTESDKS
ncbi:transposase [uncultured Algimonas sp.]|uniref:transposase n=1 Tax=uncultured Algimonas sp. TaxID=1547920 RepID=UPI002625549E|nr:transposase [uncultured Algimonas sp.]